MKVQTKSERKEQNEQQWKRKLKKWKNSSFDTEES